MSLSTGLRGWRRLAWIAAGATYLLIVLGGVVRVTESGMGCGPDWPRCDGAWIPAFDLPTLIEWTHRLAAAGVSALVLALGVWAFRRRGEEAWRLAWKAAAAAAVLLGVQVLLGAVTVRLELPPWSVMLHLGTALLLLSALLVGALGAEGAGGARGGAVAGWTRAAAAYAFLVVLAGGFVANLDAAAACSGFPLCGGSWWPSGSWRAQVHWIHRFLAYGLVAVALALPLLVRRQNVGRPALRRVADGAAAVALLQLAAGAAMVLGKFGVEIRVVHAALGTGLYALLVVVAWRAGARLPGSSAGSRARAA